ncbi:aminoadipate-semialdehyde dehydrogenase isoform X1 [Amblyomma americanum]
MLTLHGCMEVVAERYSSKIAVVYDDGTEKTTHTYLELLRRAQEVSQFISGLGISPAIIACLCKARASVVGLILGVLKSNCAFAFLASECPEKNVKTLTNAAVNFYILGEQSLYEKCKFSTNGDWTILGTLWDNTFILASCNGNATKHLDKPVIFTEPQMAYVMFTSGTTGEPKVVRVPHECALVNIQHLRSIFNISEEDIIFQAAPLTFDPSVIEIFLALTSGAQLVLTSEAVKQIPRAVTQLLVDNLVTVIQATPNFIRSLGANRIKESLLSSASPLRVLAFGGEECPSGACINSWRQRGNETEIYNLYGITEVSCWATCHRIGSADVGAIPLGEPLDGTLLEVRDDAGTIISEGDGTLFIGGSVRRCLVGNEKWEHLDPCHMRDSGDVVRKSSNGLTFLGRNDSVFKYHGKKINPAHLSRRLRGTGMVESCHCHFCTEEEVLFFFVILSSTCDIETAAPQLRQSLEGECQCPFRVEVVPSWPLTSHGKIDVEALVAFHRKRKLQDAVPDVHLLLAKLWNDLSTKSDHPVVPGDMTFVAAGGNSLGAVRISQELEFALGRSLPLLVDKILNDKFSDVQAYLTSVAEKRELPDHRVQRKRARLAPPTVVQCTSSLSGRVKCTSCFTCTTRFGTWHHCGCAEHCLGQKVTGADHAYTRPVVSERWKYNLGKCIDASPLIVSYQRGDTLVLIGSHAGRFCALNENSGDCLWEISVPDRIESSAGLSSCGRYVAFGCYDHHIYCVDIVSGAVKWTLSTGAVVKSSPATNRTNNSFVCGSHDRYLYCMTQDIGSLLWKRRLSEGSIFASPSVSYNPYQIYGATLDGLVAALCPATGEMLWTCKLDKPIFSSPTICDTGVGVCCVDGKVFLLSHTNGSKLWVTEAAAPIFSTLSLTDGAGDPSLVVGCHNQCVYKLSVKDGRILWQAHLDSPVFSTLFCPTDRPFYVGATTKGTLCIINSESGEVQTSHCFDNEVFSSPVLLEDHIIVGCRNNYVYCLVLESKCFI